MVAPSYFWSYTCGSNSIHLEDYPLACSLLTCWKLFFFVIYFIFSTCVLKLLILSSSEEFQYDKAETVDLILGSGEPYEYYFILLFRELVIFQEWYEIYE